jgi:hypothetical protein
MEDLKRVPPQTWLIIAVTCFAALCLVIAAVGVGNGDYSQCTWTMLYGKIMVCK